MKIKNYSVSIFFEKRVLKKGTSLSPIELTVNLSGAVQFRLRLKLYANKEDFDKAMKGSGGSEEVKELRKEINEYVSKAELILNNLPIPRKDIFIKMFKSSTNLFTTNKTDVEFFFREKISSLKKEERFGTAETYDLALKSLKRFSPKLYFESIDEKFLKDYIEWNKVKGNTHTTIDFYLKNLKAIFNAVIKDGVISEKLYPFKNIKISGSEKSKNVLYLNQIKQLWEYKPTLKSEKRAKDMFFFCYLANGMNFKDVAFLKWDSINNDMLIITREKTKRTKTTPKKIKVYISDNLKAIIEEWSIKNSSHNYVFPYVGTYNDAEMRENARLNWQKKINKSLRVIGNNLGFNINLTLALARHSFATQLKLDKVPIAFISDAMGHSSSTTTEFYLKSIPDEVYKDISSSLLKF